MILGSKGREKAGKVGVFFGGIRYFFVLLCRYYIMCTFAKSPIPFLIVKPQKKSYETLIFYPDWRCLFGDSPSAK
jgi:hypothetical protein